MGDTVLVIGVGQIERQDDGVGPVVAEGLRARGRLAIAHEGDGTGLLDLWDAAEACIVIDAVAGGGPVGSLRVFVDAGDPAIARSAFVHSSHRIGLPEALALGRALNRLPDRLTVIGVTGARFGTGRGLSPDVARAAERLIRDLPDSLPADALN